MVHLDLIQAARCSYCPFYFCSVSGGGGSGGGAGCNRNSNTIYFSQRLWRRWFSQKRRPSGLIRPERSESRSTVVPDGPLVSLFLPRLSSHNLQPSVKFLSQISQQPHGGPVNNSMQIVSSLREEIMCLLWNCLFYEQQQETQQCLCNNPVQFKDAVWLKDL